jgi:hypothetical protein
VNALVRSFGKPYGRAGSLSMSFDFEVLCAGAMLVGVATHGDLASVLHIDKVARHRTGVLRGSLQSRIQL